MVCMADIGGAGEGLAAIAWIVGVVSLLLIGGRSSMRRWAGMADDMPTLHVRAGLSKDVTLHVRLVGLKQWAIRIWLATCLIRTAAWVLGCSVNVDTGALRRDGLTPEGHINGPD